MKKKIKNKTTYCAMKLINILAFIVNKQKGYSVTQSLKKICF